MTTIYVKSKHNLMLYTTFEEYINQHNDDFELNFEGLQTIVASFSDLQKSSEKIRTHLKGKTIHLLEHTLDCHQRMYLQNLENKCRLTCIYNRPSRWDLLWWIWTFWQLGFWLTLGVLKRGRILLKDLI